MRLHNVFSRTKVYFLKICAIARYMDVNYVGHKSWISQEARLNDHMSKTCKT